MDVNLQTLNRRYSRELVARVINSCGGQRLPGEDGVFWFGLHIAVSHESQGQHITGWHLFDAIRTVTGLPAWNPRAAGHHRLNGAQQIRLSESGYGLANLFFANLMRSQEFCELGKALRHEFYSVWRSEHPLVIRLQSN